MVQCCFYNFNSVILFKLSAECLIPHNVNATHKPALLSYVVMLYMFTLSAIDIVG